MKRSLSILAVSFALVCSSFAGTLILHFIHQPLTTLGTEGDAVVVMARVDPALLMSRQRVPACEKQALFA